MNENDIRSKIIIYGTCAITGAVSSIVTMYSVIKETRRTVERNITSELEKSTDQPEGES